MSKCSPYNVSTDISHSDLKLKSVHEKSKNALLASSKSPNLYSQSIDSKYCIPFYSRKSTRKTPNANGAGTFY